jgi:hypothetical protein
MLGPSLGTEQNARLLARSDEPPTIVAHESVYNVTS